MAVGLPCRDVRTRAAAGDVISCVLSEQIKWIYLAPDRNVSDRPVVLKVTGDGLQT